MPRQLGGPIPTSSASIFLIAFALAKLMLPFNFDAQPPVSPVSPFLIAPFRLFLSTLQSVLQYLVSVRLLYLLARIRHQALFRLK